MQTAEKQWMTKKQAQAHAAIGKTLLDDLIRSGQVQAADVGLGEKRPTIRVNRESLDEYMNRNLLRS
jgi:hypothetical protein